MLSTRMHTLAISQAFTATGAKVPAPVTAMAKKAADVTQQLDTLTRAQAQIGEAVAASLMAGKDPLKDPAVTRSVVTTALVNSNVGEVVQQRIDLEVRRTYIKCLDDIITAWRAPFDRAAATMRSAVEVLGDIPLDATGDVVQLGGNAAQLWADATAADRAIDAINGGWHALVTLTQAAAGDNRYRILRMADVTYEQWQTHELPGRKLTAWDASRLGLTLSLPTAAEYVQRVNAIRAGDADIERQQVDAFKNAMGRRNDVMVQQAFAQRAGAVR